MINFKDLKEIKNAIKSTNKSKYSLLYRLETIVFDMDNTIMTIMYKKNEI